MTARQGAMRAVILLCALTIVSYVDRTIVSLLVEPIRHDMGISDIQIGLLSGFAFILLYCVAGVPIARFADRGSRRTLIGGGALLWGVMTMASGFVDRFELLLLCRLGVGLGEAALVPAAMSIFADLFPPERRAGPVSLFFGCSILGAAAAHALGGAALRAAEALGAPGGLAPWQLTFVLVGVPAVVLAVLFLVLVPEPSRTTLGAEPVEGDRDHPSAVRQFLREHRLFGRYFLGIALYQIVLFGLGLWTVPFLGRVHGLSAASAGIMASATGGVGAVASAFVVPFVAARLVAGGHAARLPVLAATFMALSMPLVAMVFLMPSLPGALTALAVAQFCVVGLYTTPQILAQRYAAPQHRAQFVAIYLLLGNVIGAGAGGVLIPSMARAFFSGSPAIGQATALASLIVTPIAILLVLSARTAIAGALDRGHGPAH